MSNYQVTFIAADGETNGNDYTVEDVRPQPGDNWILWNEYCLMTAEEEKTTLPWHWRNNETANV